MSLDAFNPSAIVAELDKYIVGQDAAKRAVAIALRNRVRRALVTDPVLREEITPKNILMIGSTGVGKTEIARRLARFANAPFIKVEATKFTEVGYVGRDVDSIIRDLVDVAVKKYQKQAIDEIRPQAQKMAEQRVLDIITGTVDPYDDSDPDLSAKDNSIADSDKGTNSMTRKRFLQMLREGKLDERIVELELSAPAVGMEIMGPPGMEEMTNQLREMFQNMHSDKKRLRKLSVKEARSILAEELAGEMIDMEEIKMEAVKKVEQNGIVFIDEIDKVAVRKESHGSDVSREGVQRDLLPLVEGTTVMTKYGVVQTDHILFIASGAFHLSKPSDLVPELQGRMPIRVELEALTVDDFTRILTELDTSLPRQYAALLATENFTLEFSQDGIRRIAEVAFEINERLENIGARRLHTVMERVLEQACFDASKNGRLEVDKGYVDKYLQTLLQDEDLSKYIL